MLHRFIIYILADYSLLCRLPNDPYDVMGCWCNDNYFLVGTMLWHYGSFDASIWLCSPPTVKSKKKSSITHDLDETDGEISTLHNNVEEKTKAAMDCDNDVKECSSKKEQKGANGLISHLDNELSQLRENETQLKHTNEPVVFSWYKKELLKFRNLQVWLKKL